MFNNSDSKVASASCSNNRRARRTQCTSPSSLYVTDSEVFFSGDETSVRQIQPPTDTGNGQQARPNTGRAPLIQESARSRIPPSTRTQSEKVSCHADVGGSGASRPLEASGGRAGRASIVRHESQEDILSTLSRAVGVKKDTMQKALCVLKRRGGNDVSRLAEICETLATAKPCSDSERSSIKGTVVDAGHVPSAPADRQPVKAGKQSVSGGATRGNPRSVQQFVKWSRVAPSGGDPVQRRRVETPLKPSSELLLSFRVTEGTGASSCGYVTSVSDEGSLPSRVVLASTAKPGPDDQPDDQVTILTCDEQTLTVSRNMLRKHSQFFEEILSRNGQRSKHRRVVLGSVPLGPLACLVDWMRTGRLDVTVDTYVMMEETARSLKMWEAVKVCKSFLRRLTQTTRNPFQLYDIGVRVSSAEIREKALASMGQSFQEIVFSRSFADLSVDSVCLLLSNDHARLASEIEFFDAAIRWLRCRPASDATSNVAHLEMVMSCVRFKLMSTAQLKKVIALLDKAHVAWANACYADILQVCVSRLEVLENCSGKVSALTTSSSSCHQIAPRSASPAKNRPRKTVSSALDVADRKGCGGDDLQTRCRPLVPSGDRPAKLPVVVVAASPPPPPPPPRVSSGARPAGDQAAVLPMEPARFPSITAFLILGGVADKPEGATAAETTADKMLALDVVRNEWVCAGRMPGACRETAACCWGGMVYVAGGCHVRAPPQDSGPPVATATFWQLDSRTGLWTTLRSMMQPRRLHALVAVDHKIYAIGGKSDRQRILDTVERFCPKTNVWTTVGALNTARCGAAVAVHRDTIWACGGTRDYSNYGWRDIGTVSTDAHSIVDSMENYDSIMDRWSVVKASNSILACRTMASLLSVGDHLYLVGGIRSATAPSGSSDRREDVVSTVAVFNHGQEAWSVHPHLNVARTGALALYKDPYILVVGGRQPEVDAGDYPIAPFTTSVLAYDLQDNVLLEGAPLPYSLNGFSCINFNNESNSQ